MLLYQLYFNRDTFLGYSEFPRQNEAEMVTYFKTGIAFNYINRLDTNTINWSFSLSITFTQKI